MPKRKNNDHQRRPKPERRFSVRGVRRDPPDLRKLGKALIALAQAEAEAAAQAEHQAGTNDPPPDGHARQAGDDPADERQEEQPEEGGVPDGERHG